MINDRDLSELDALESLVISDGWRLVVERIESMIEFTRDEMERWPQTHHSQRSIEGLQGHVRALRTMLDLPAILKAEYEAEAKR